jgi:hypothetical protein
MKNLIIVALFFCFIGCSSAPVSVSSAASQDSPDSPAISASMDNKTQTKSNSDLCLDAAGCLLADGRHIAQNTPQNIVIEDFTQECPWHWHNSMPRGTASSCVFGDCVLPGADNVVPISTASDRPSPFLCDLEACECGIVPPAICRHNEVCVDELKLCSPLNLSQHCPLLAHPTTESFNPHICPGGRLVCQGIDNAPVTRPHSQDIWECRNVTTVPENIRFNDNGHYKAWICAQTEGCTCKNQKIAMHEPCF